MILALALAVFFVALLVVFSVPLFFLLEPRRRSTPTLRLRPGATPAQPVTPPIWPYERRDR